MWHRVCAMKDLPKSSGKTFEIDSKKIALFNSAGKFYALYSACVHRGGPLGEGHLHGLRVTCPWHAWEFDVKTGECSTMKGAKQPRYATKVKEGEIWVETKD